MTHEEQDDWFSPSTPEVAPQNNEPEMERRKGILYRISDKLRGGSRPLERAIDPRNPHYRQGFREGAIFESTIQRERSVQATLETQGRKIVAERFVSAYGMARKTGNGAVELKKGSTLLDIKNGYGVIGISLDKTFLKNPERLPIILKDIIEGINDGLKSQGSSEALDTPKVVQEIIHMRLGNLIYPGSGHDIHEPNYATYDFPGTARLIVAKTQNPADLDHKHIGFTVIDTATKH